MLTMRNINISGKLIKKAIIGFKNLKYIKFYGNIDDYNNSFHTIYPVNEYDPLIKIKNSFK